MQDLRAVDISETALHAFDHEAMETLLIDHTTHRNILWCTDDYAPYGEGFSEADEITVGNRPHDTFLSIGKFASAEEASACLKYVKTKFARCMLGTLKATQHNPSETWANVPLQDFTSGSDIDWSQSIADIDRQLYKKYELTDDEIAFIESMIKPM